MTDSSKTTKTKTSDSNELKTIAFSLQPSEQLEVDGKLDTLLERLRSSPAYRGVRLSSSGVARMAFMRGLDMMLQEVR